MFATSATRGCAVARFSNDDIGNAPASRLDGIRLIYLICEHGAVDLMTGAMAFPVRAAGESPAQMSRMRIGDAD